MRAWVTNMIHECYPTWDFGMWAMTEKATQVVIGYCGPSRFPNRCGNDEAGLGFRLACLYWAADMHQKPQPKSVKAMITGLRCNLSATMRASARCSASLQIFGRLARSQAA